MSTTCEEYLLLFTTKKQINYTTFVETWFNGCPGVIRYVDSEYGIDNQGGLKQAEALRKDENLGPPIDKVVLQYSKHKMKEI